MPVDPSMADAMLGTFRTMAKDCQDKGSNGEAFDNMMAALNRMEQLATELNDVSDLSVALMNENLYMEFSNNYTKVLSAAYKSDYDPNAPYDEKADQALMKQSLNAYRDAIRQIKDSKEETKKLMGERSSDLDVLYKEQRMVDAIQAVIDLGESGISYAEWCKRLITQGLDKAMEGSVLSRENVEWDVKFAEAMAVSPAHIEAAKRKLQKFDELAAQSPIKMPETFKYQLACDKIDWELEPEQLKWYWIKDKWEKLFNRLEEWIMSYTSMAPYIFPWNQHSNPQASVKESQACAPGLFRAWENMCKDYFGMNAEEMFNHPSFDWEIRYGFHMHSKVYTEFLLKEIMPICNPNAKPSDELVKKAEEMHKNHLVYRPDNNIPYQRLKKVFDERFGDGWYVQRHGLPGEGAKSNAEPWGVNG
ncbi:MAG: hypothetical protein ACK40M_08025 [Flavobacteriales bacterium]